MQDYGKGGEKMDNYSIEIEKAVLCSALINRASLLQCIDLLTEDDFYIRDTKTIFKAIKKCVENNKTVDVVTIADMTKNDDIQFIDIYKTNALPTNIPAYINKLIDYKKRRQLFNYSVYIKDLLNDKELEFDDIFQTLTGELDSIDKQLNNITQCDHFVENGIDDLQSKVKYVNTGFAPLDDILCGFGGSQLILLGARPGGGKTSLALNISTNISKHKPVLFYSFEMSSPDLTCRILSSMASVEFWKIKFNKMSQFEKERIDNALQRFKKLNLYFAGRMNLTQIINSIKSFHTKQEIGLTVIDYLQLVPTSQAEQRYIEVGNISRELKNIAVDLNIPVFALSQLNRNMDYRQDKHPVLADLRESGSLEQDSDVVLFLHHDEKEKNTSLIIAKNRNGATGRETLFFDKKFTKFIDTGCLFDQVKEVEDGQGKLLEVKW